MHPPSSSSGSSKLLSILPNRLNVCRWGGEIFKVDLDVARKSQTIRDMMDSLGIEQDSTNEEAIPLPNKEITGKIFKN